MKRTFSFCLLLILLSCQNKEKPKLAFYYWKTVFKLSEKEKSALSQNQISKIYLRYFDVALNPNSNQPSPIAVIQFDQSTKGLEIVPVIYIKNEVMLSHTVDVHDLSNKISKLINQINAIKAITVKEIQLDCDWSLNSRDKYMDFINQFRKENKCLISTTIRLHQVKYFNKTKVPQVDKGVLMYYNMGKIDTAAANSIYDKKIADKYLKSLNNYPMPLNIALPFFSCGIHIRNGNVIGLKSKITELELQEDANFVKVKPHFFKAGKANYKHGIYYKKGDLLKIESVSEENLLEMASDLSGELKQPPKEIILYDLDELNLDSYDKDIFTKISNCF